MYHCIFIENGKIQLQTLTYGYQDCLDPDIFQYVMSKLVQDMEYVETISCLDDLLILTNCRFKDHLLKLEMRNGSSKTIKRWYESECIVISKSKFFAEQIEYLALGYWITRQGIKPVRNKVEMLPSLILRRPKQEKRNKLR
jgi:hypothetical protein